LLVFIAAETTVMWLIHGFTKFFPVLLFEIFMILDIILIYYLYHPDSFTLTLTADSAGKKGVTIASPEEKNGS